MNKYFAYVRVSGRQRAQNDLQFQKSQIKRHAARNSLVIPAWFEEHDTAIRPGRNLFERMVKQLHRGGARGLIVERLSRVSRNLPDWARISQVVGNGVELHSVRDSMAYGSGSVDLQTAIAINYGQGLRRQEKKPSQKKNSRRESVL